MAGTGKAARVARIEALFREANEQIAESAERFGADDAEFFCECGDAACTCRVEATIAEYERVRAEPTTFLVAEGHENEQVEAPVERDGDAAVVRKQHPAAARVARETDPRS